MKSGAGRTRLLLVRHGETPWNAAGRWQGHADPGLTARGREQAEALARSLASRADCPWTRLLVSDLARARETAGIVGEALGLAPEVDARLRELDVGNWSGLTRSEIEDRDADRLKGFEGGDLGLRPGDGETRFEVADRVRAFAADAAVRWAGEAVIVVTHLGVVRALAPGAEPENAGAVEVFADAASRGDVIAEGTTEEGGSSSGDL